MVKVEAKEAGGRVLLVDHLPAGFEIENPRIVDSGDIKSLAWLKTTAQPEHTEFRDDRFVAAFNFSGSNVQNANAEQAGTPDGTTQSQGTGRNGDGRLRRARGDAGHLRPPGGDGRGHVPSAALRADGGRHAHRHAGRVRAGLRPNAPPPFGGGA